MAAGGLSVSDIDHLKDLKFSAEYLLNQWLYKYGSEDAQRYYEHLRVVVRGDCLAAQQSVLGAPGLYGAAMLADLRERLEQRSAKGEIGTPACHAEHLLGLAGILTEDCKVWWSSEFRLPEGSA